MEDGPKEIKALFDGTKIFRVPMYQRAYAWSDKQLNDFFDDIKNQKVDRAYFLGTILLEKCDSEGDFSLIDIVDGQQRVTTLVIFMRELLYLLRKSGENIEILEETYVIYKNRFKLQLQEEDNEFFHTYILSNNENVEMVKQRPSQNRLLLAKKYFHDRLNLLEKDKLLEIKDKVNRTKILTYSVTNSAEAALIFETTNDRGKPLTKLEKIKSFFMYKYYIANPNSDDILKSIYKRFSDIYSITDFIKIDHEDSILQYHYIMYEQWSKKNDYQKYLENTKFHVNSLLIQNKDESVTKYIDEYTIKLKEVFYAISEIQNKVNYEILDQVFYLDRLSVFYPILIKTYQFDNSSDKLYFKDIVKLIEIFSFRVFGLKTKRTSDVDSALNKIANNFDGNFDLLKYQIVEKIIEYCDDQKFEEKLSSTYFYKEYRTDRVYFYWKYENFLRDKSGYTPMSIDDLQNMNKRTQLTIEHIAPQNPEENEKRLVTKNNIEFPDYNSDEFKTEYLHSIGNLTFDPRSSNSSKGRKSIEEKNSKYFQKAPYLSQNELDTFFVNQGIWDKNTIDNRKTKLLQFALKTWNPLKIVGQEKYSQYIDEKESKEKNKIQIYDEEYVKSRMGQKPYQLLTELRNQLKNISKYQEKINKYFIGLKNHKYYFAVIYWRQKELTMYIIDYDPKKVIVDDNIEFFENSNELAVKINNIEEIKKYLPLVKNSKRYNEQ